jgi:hypothetical protein
MNKIQQLAAKVNINRLSVFRERLAEFGVSSGTAWNVWTYGATTKNDHLVIHALEQVLMVSAMNIVEDPESLILKGQTK